MSFEENLKKYADLAVKSGVALQKGQKLVVRCPVECADFARLLAKSGYETGASEVIVQYNDEQLSLLKYQNCEREVFENVPDWMAEFNNSYARENAAFISVLATDPDLFKDIDPSKMAAWTKAMHKACKEFYDKLDINACTWNIVSVPTKAWAKKVFPDKDTAEAIKLLWDAIFKATRVDTPDPIKAWEEHKKSFEQKTKWLNDKQFDYLHYKSLNGTDIKIGLNKDHIWAGGGDETPEGLSFFPNMPTEEIFTSPDKNRADGVVKSSLPLNHGGNLIEDFSITFKEGKVVDYSAKTGYETLKAIIETDEGSKSLGEVALVPNDSPISNMGILFYNTLYDENAACHFALGIGFPTCIKDGIKMSKEELIKNGVNDSAEHVDFMIGTKDMEITGYDKEGNATKIFENGNWAF